MKTLEQYNLPKLPEGFKKKFWIDGFGNTCCVIYEKDNRCNVVSFGVAWLNESDKYVVDRVKGKAIAYGRAYKSLPRPIHVNPDRMALSMSFYNPKNMSI